MSYTVDLAEDIKTYLTGKTFSQSVTFVRENFPIDHPEKYSATYNAIVFPGDRILRRETRAEYSIRATVFVALYAKAMADKLREDEVIQLVEEIEECLLQRQETDTSPKMCRVDDIDITISPILVSAIEAQGQAVGVVPATYMLLKRGTAPIAADARYYVRDIDADYVRDVDADYVSGKP